MRAPRKSETSDRRFTKEEMLDELRTIFLFEADHIASGAGAEQAKAFIGFESDQYWKEDPSRVDLSRFVITNAFEASYNRAFHPSVICGWGEEMLDDITNFMLGVPRSGGQGGEAGETHEFMTPDGKCQIVVDAMMARSKIELPENFGGDLTTRELALLANMSEGAVRNALADKSENGLRAIPGSKPIAVTHEDALRWLQGRRGFVPSPVRLLEDKPLHERIEALKTAEGLGNIVNWLFWVTFKSPEKAPAALGWTAEEAQAWCDGTFQFDAELAAHLAKALDIDVPSFVGKALEVSLRRDAKKE